MITTKTGAFYPAIPPYYVAQKLHDLLIDQDPLSTIDPQTCKIPQGSSVDFVKMLNLMWQVKTFDIITDYKFKNPPEIANASVLYIPAKEGQIISADVPLIDPRRVTDPENPEEPGTPTNPWIDIALGVAVGNITFVQTPYPENRNDARTQLRQTYGGSSSQYFRTVTIKSNLSYPQEKNELLDDFDFYFQDWTDRTQATLDKLQDNTTAGGLKWIAEMQRILSVIPTIKTELETQFLNPRIASLDVQYASQNNTDPDFQIASDAKSESFYFRNLITLEEDIQLFDLYKGFEQGLEFLNWHNQRRFGAECFATQQGFQLKKYSTADYSESGVFPCGFYFDTVLNSYLSAILLTEQQQFRYTLSAPTVYEVQKKFGENLSTQSVTASKTLYYYSSLIGTDQSRVRKEAVVFFGDGNVSGGLWAPVENPNSTEIFGAGAYFEELYNPRTGEEIQVDDPPSFADLEYENADEIDGIVYSGPYFSGRNWTAARDYFADLVAALEALRNAETAEIGTLRFKSADDDVIYETPIFGNPLIWQKHDITYKIKTRWNDPTPAP